MSYILGLQLKIVSFHVYRLKMSEIVAVIMIKLSQYSFGDCLYSQLNQIGVAPNSVTHQIL